MSATVREVDTTISQRELRNDSGAIMRRVEQGESFTVTRNGTPVADLVPHRPSEAQRSRFVSVDVIAAGLTPLPAWGVREFADELDQLDLAVDDADVDPWNQR
jgi:prevent-host-death family protein